MGERPVGRRVMRIALLVTLGLPLACGAPREVHYTPALAVPSAVHQAAGTLRGDFDLAARARSAAEAVSLWRDFIRRYEPPDGEYEDEFQKNLLDTAKLELARAHYLLGEAAAGDSVLKALNPLQL